MPHTFSRILADAESLWKSGAYDAASLRIEDLPPADRIAPAVFDLRVRIAIGACAWDMGETVSNLLIESPEESHRQTVAQFYHAYAAALCERGEIDKAEERVKRAVELWPMLRMEILEDERLATFFKI